MRYLGTCDYNKGMTLQWEGESNDYVRTPGILSRVWWDARNNGEINMAGIDYPVQVYADTLKVGDVLDNGNTVESVATYSYARTTVWMESDGTMREEWSFYPVALAERTNCLYGGLGSGHSRHNCTASACY